MILISLMRHRGLQTALISLLSSKGLAGRHHQVRYGQA
jgi:hypothetical protein